MSEQRRQSATLSGHNWINLARGWMMSRVAGEMLAVSEATGVVLTFSKPHPGAVQETSFPKMTAFRDKQPSCPQSRIKS